MQKKPSIFINQSLGENSNGLPALRILKVLNLL